MHTPLTSSSSTPLASTPSTKKRQREKSSIRPKNHKSIYRIVPGKSSRLQPYVICLLEEVLTQGTPDVLNYPLLPDLPQTEPETRRKMRQHLRKRFQPLRDNSDLVRFMEKLLELWGARLLPRNRRTGVISARKSDLLMLITPLRRPRDILSHQKLDDLGEGDLLQLDFLEDEVDFPDNIGTIGTTMEDNWNSSRTNLRRVTYHETPSAVARRLPSVEPPIKLVEESKAKRAKISNPKRGMRWTTAERKLFLQGLERWGAGNWKSIHKIIPGR